MTREPARQKQWVGCVLIRTMVTSALNDAMSNGTVQYVPGETYSDRRMRVISWGAANEFD